MSEAIRAFPIGSGQAPQKGMDLRDYFAAHASEKDIEEHSEYVSRYESSTHRSNVVFTRTREAARYIYADAMIEARKGGNDER